MAVASLMFGLFALGAACIGFFPGLNLVNLCATLPLSFLGVVVSIVALAQPPERNGRAAAGAGLALSLLAMLVAGVRIVISLLVGGGVL